MDGIHGAVDSEDRMNWKAEEEAMRVAPRETKWPLGGSVTWEVGGSRGANTPELRRQGEVVGWRRYSEG